MRPANSRHIIYLQIKNAHAHLLTDVSVRFLLWRKYRFRYFRNINKVYRQKGIGEANFVPLHKTFY